jgi:hypothetical protein
MRRLVLAMLVSMLFCSSIHADYQRVTLRGRFVFGGEAPRRKAVKVDKDEGVCAMKLLDERLIVDAKTRGVANVVVQLVVARDAKPPVHPQLEELRETPRVFAVENCRLEPHVVTVLKGQKLVIENRDKVGHNIKLDVINNDPFCDNIPSGVQLTKIFKALEPLPVIASCVIHPWMRGHVVITDHPYVAISGSDGKFTIPDLPPGEWTFRVWHEASGFVKEVTVNKEKQTWEKGRFTLTLSEDKDLGEIVVAADRFKVE